MERWRGLNRVREISEVTVMYHTGLARASFDGGHMRLVLILEWQPAEAYGIYGAAGTVPKHTGAPGARCVVRPGGTSSTEKV